MTLLSRLTWILLATLLPLGLAVGVGLYAFVRVSLYARLDDALSARAEALAAAVKWHNGTLEFDFEDAAMPQYQAQVNANSKQAAYFEMWRIQGNELGPLIERSKSMGSEPLVDRRRLADRVGRESRWNADLADGTDVRVLAMRIEPAIEREDPSSDAPTAKTEPPNDSTASQLRNADRVPEVLVAVAVSRDAVDRPLEVLAIGLALAGVVLAVAGLASLRWAIAKGLAPVSELAEQVAGVDAENLGTRLAVPRLPPEIAPIQDRVNALLVRIEGAMQREKRFTSAAAHELRTPIAELRMLLEVAASQERTSQQWTQTADRALAVLVRAQSLCEALLRLSRAGADQSSLSTLVQAGIESVIVEQAERAIALHRADPSRVRMECAPACFARVDTAMLGSIVGNLLDNALRHGEGTAGDPILIRGSRTQDSILIKISNPAPGITQDDVAHLFEPFWRKDSSRHDQTGFGLGLSVARTLARAINGDVSALLEPPSTLTICLTLQAASEHGAATP
jgi:hypothetical protein